MKVVNGEEDEAETVKAVFAALRDTETDAEEYLLDDDWQMPEPEAVVFDAGCSGTSSEEPVTESSGLDDEAQQTLFSCTEFMAEVPAVRRGRSWKRP